MMKTPLAIVALYITVVTYGLSTTIYEHQPDARVQDWFLMKRWTPIIIIISTYFLIVLTGPRLMQNRAPFTLRTVLKCYNLVQVVMSAYMFKEFLISAWKSNYSLKCQPVDYSNSDLALRMAAACWWFFFSKIIDLFDTVFFILRKKNSQVSFLHVYHHSSMILNWWLGAKYTPGGQIFFQCMLNSFVHMVMYSYYFLSAFGPSVQKFLWWKRYLTQLQLIQFCLIIVHLINGMTTDCGFPYIFNWYVIVYCVTLIALFTNFYVETYSHQQRDRRAALAAKKEAAEAEAALAAAAILANGKSGKGGAPHYSYNNNNGLLLSSSSNGVRKPMGQVINRSPYVGDKYVAVSNSNGTMQMTSSSRRH